MTLKDMKIKTFSLIEEYYPELAGLAEDEDVLNKINGVVNQIQMDLMKLRKINAVKEIEIDSEDDKTINLKSAIDDLYQLRKIDIDVEYSMPNEDILVLPEDYTGTFSVYYYKYPALVELEPEESTTEPSESELEEEESEEETETEPTYDETFTFDLDADLLEIMPYGIAADLLKMDMISNYGKYFYERYLEMKKGVDPRRTSVNVQIVGGVEWL